MLLTVSVNVQLKYSRPVIILLNPPSTMQAHCGIPEGACVRIRKEGGENVVPVEDLRGAAGYRISGR